MGSSEPFTASAAEEREGSLPAADQKLSCDCFWTNEDVHGGRLNLGSPKEDAWLRVSIRFTGGAPRPLRLASMHAGRWCSQRIHSFQRCNIIAALALIHSASGRMT